MNNLQKFSYHCHTNFSDGQNKLEEIVDQAKKIGFTELGISDHLIVHKNMYQSKTWDFMSKLERSYVYNNSFKKITDSFKKHCDEIHYMEKSKNIRLLVGFEVDFFIYDGWIEELKDFLQQLDYDYLISGNHFFCSENGEEILNIDCLKKQIQNVQNLPEYISRHFYTQAKSIKSGLFSFLAHMDYVRKLGDDFCGPTMYMTEKRMVIDTLKQNNTGIEISTKGLRKIGDFYPSSEILSEVAKQDVKVVISDDAHSVEELGADFSKAESELKKFNIKRRIKL